VFDPEALLKSRRARPAPVEEVKKLPVEVEDEEAAEVEGAGIEEVEDEVGVDDLEEEAEEVARTRTTCCSKTPRNWARTRIWARSSIWRARTRNGDARAAIHPQKNDIRVNFPLDRPTGFPDISATAAHGAPDTGKRRRDGIR